jgi:hypothetical protein
LPGGTDSEQEINGLYVCHVSITFLHLLDFKLLEDSNFILFILMFPVLRKVPST